MKSQALYTVWYDITGEAAGEVTLGTPNFCEYERDRVAWEVPRGPSTSVHLRW